MNRGKIVVFRSLAVLVASAFLAAISVVCGKYLAIPVGEVMRFSFENLPVIMAGIFFGPIIGATVGAVADIIGCILVGYTINPIVTAGAAVIGFTSGLVYIICNKLKVSSNALKVTFSVVAAHLIGSVIIKTVGLSAFYSISLPILMLWRLLNYVIVAILEVIILCYLTKSKLIVSQINSITGKGKK